MEVEKGKKKKGRILEHKKGRTLVRTSQPVKILPVCSNGTETVVGISNRHLIMEVLEIVYLRLSRFCIYTVKKFDFFLKPTNQTKPRKA